MTDLGPMPALGGPPLLVVSSVVKRFGGFVAVDRASFSVAKGSITALIGPNGAGKSTLFNVISGLLRSDAGTVEFSEEDVTSMLVHQRARLGLGRTFQQPRVHTKLSVLDNILVAAPSHPRTTLSGLARRPFGARSEERLLRDRAIELLSIVRLEDLATEYAGALSGGQRKLLEFARVLMSEPKLILMDEPLAGVNPALRSELVAHVESTRRDRGVTFLIVEHDVETIMSTADWIVVMNAGRVLFQGLPSDVRNSEAVIDAYLGDSERSVHDGSD